MMMIVLQKSIPLSHELAEFVGAEEVSEVCLLACMFVTGF